MATEMSSDNNSRSRSASDDGVQGNNPMKKTAKLFNYIPPVINGVICASKTPVTPVVDKGRLIDFETHEVRSLSHFFESNLEDVCDIPEYTVADSVTNALKNPEESEKALRDTVYTDLMDNHGIKFPKSSKKSESMVSDTKKSESKEYLEQNLASLLEEYGQEEHVRFTSIQGVPVKTTSEPDLAPLDTRGPITQIRLGVFKNAKNYIAEKARTQCIMYLLGLLYYLRVELGYPVESVYGFYFCGCRCGDQRGETYEVGIIKLSAPQFLNDRIITEYWPEIAEVGNPVPLRLLIHFLKEGKKWTITKSQMPADRRIPSLFVLPTSLWEDEGNERSLVVHGTLSIVFKMSAQGLKRLLMNKDSPHFNDMSTNPNWIAYCEDVLALCERNNTDEFFIKIRTRDAASEYTPMEAMWDQWDILSACPEISKTYPLRPYSFKHLGVVVMHNRGLPLEDIPDFEEPKSVVKEFQKVMETATLLIDHLHHGDVLPHNLVYDETTGEMTLIDIDEGVGKHRKNNQDHLLQRKNEYTGGSDDWFIALTYPNPLRKHASAYTQSQLIASFLYLITKIRRPPNSVQDDHEALLSKAKELGEQLCILDKKSSQMRRDKEIELLKAAADAYTDLTRIVAKIAAEP